MNMNLGLYTITFGRMKGVQGVQSVQGVQGVHSAAHGGRVYVALQFLLVFVIQKHYSSNTVAIQHQYKSNTKSIQ